MAITPSDSISMISFRPQLCLHNKDADKPNQFIVKQRIVYNLLHVSARKVIIGLNRKTKKVKVKFSL